MKEYATLAIAVVELIASSEKYVAVIAPIGGPRIFDFVVGKVVERPKADSEYAMIEIGATIAGEDARFVELKIGLIGLNSDRDGIKRESRNKGEVIRGSDIGKGNNLGTIDKRTSFETGAG